MPSSSSTVPKTIKVVAPCNLQAGYKLQVTTIDDGEAVVTITVPAGGFQRGKTYEVPHPHSKATPTRQLEANQAASHRKQKVTKKNADGSQFVETWMEYANGTKSVSTRRVYPGAPIVPATSLVPTKGQWRFEILQICSLWRHCIFWTSWFCAPVLLGQVMQRLRLSVCGTATSEHTTMPTKSDDNNDVCLSNKRTCLATLVLFFVAMIVSGAVAGVIGGKMPVRGIGVVIFLAFMVLLFALPHALTRRHVRKLYSIPPDVKLCPDVVVSDLCCALTCPCCSILQMARHTHDESQYPYHLTTATGLSPTAAQIV